MSKTIIEVKCIDQVLTLTNTPVIASGGQGEDYVHFDLCEKWDGFAVSGVFWRKGVDCIPVLLDAENTCQVPPELMTSEGVIYFGAVGVAPDGTTRTSEPVSYLIREGVITENTALPIPGEDVYQQLMAYYADVKLYVSTRIDEAADAAVQAGGNAQAALAAAEQAKNHAEDAVDAIESVIYPDVVDGYFPEAGSIGVTLGSRPSNKMLLTFRIPYNDGAVDSLSANAIKIVYPDSEGEEKTEFFMLRDGYQSAPPWEAIGFGDVVTVVLIRVPNNEAYILSPRITRTVLHEMNQRLYPGTPVSKTTDGTMTVSLNYVPEDKMVLVFAADEASSQVTKFQLKYETEGDGEVQEEYFLVDANSSRVEEYGFYPGDYVVALLTSLDKQATVLNPRVTRDTLNLIRGLSDQMAGSGGCEIVKYTGNSGLMQRLGFSGLPKVVVLLTASNTNPDSSAVIFTDLGIAKLKSTGLYGDIGQERTTITTKVTDVSTNVKWQSELRITFGNTSLPIDWYNMSGVEYIAIGIM